MPGTLILDLRRPGLISAWICRKCKSFPLCLAISLIICSMSSFVPRVLFLYILSTKTRSFLAHPPFLYLSLENAFSSSALHTTPTSPPLPSPNVHLTPPLSVPSHSTTPPSHPSEIRANFKPWTNLRMKPNTASKCTYHIFTIY